MNVMTPKFRVSYPKVFKAELNNLSQKMEYSIVALFPKGTDFSKLEAAAKSAAEEEWGKDPKKWPKMKNPLFREQTDKEKDVEGKMVLPEGMERGGKFLNLKSKQRPGLVDQDVQDIIREEDFYAGCWAKATVRAFAYNQGGNAGISFGLQNIQKIAEGDPLSGRTKAQDDFVPIGSSDSADSLFN